jgi:hypothetical protein
MLPEIACNCIREDYFDDVSQCILNRIRVVDPECYQHFDMILGDY